MMSGLAEGAGWPKLRTILLAVACVLPPRSIPLQSKSLLLIQSGSHMLGVYKLIYYKEPRAYETGKKNRT